jgi:hypothetical protein
MIPLFSYGILEKGLKPSHLTDWFTLLVAPRYKCMTKEERDTQRKTEQDEARRSNYNTHAHPRDLHML